MRADLAREVLVTHQRSFKKGPGFERARIVRNLNEAQLARSIRTLLARSTVAVWSDAALRAEATRLSSPLRGLRRERTV